MQKALFVEAASEAKPRHDGFVFVDGGQVSFDFSKVVHTTILSYRNEKNAETSFQKIEKPFISVEKTKYFLKTQFHVDKIETSKRVLFRRRLK